ncbi:hypothetical protein IWQ61_006697 [Dispira simplex]|nr:hypothetical protein IWQ61_006697 [Dispira simplex]
MYFIDRCYTETRNSEQVYIHDSFHNHRKNFPDCGCNASDDSDWSSVPDCTKIPWETACGPCSSNEHRFIEIESDENSRKFERANRSRQDTSSNSISNVAFKYNKGWDKYTYCLKWRDSKPESVNSSVKDGSIHIHAENKPTSTPLYIYKCERKDTEMFERAWKVPDDADPASLEYHYNDKLGIMEVTLKRKNSYSKFICPKICSC